MRISATLSIYLLLCGVLPLAAQGVSSSSREPRGVALFPSFYEAYLPDGEDESNRYTVPVSFEAVGSSSMEGSFGYLNAWIGRSVGVVVESASMPYTIAVNGQKVGSASSGSTPALFDITKFVQDNLNDITITFEGGRSQKVAAWQDGKAKLGEVKVISQPTMFIDDVVQRTTKSGDVTNTYLGVVVRSRALNPRTSRINYKLYDAQDRLVTEGYRDLTLSMRGEGVVMIPYNAQQDELWSAQNPQIYRLELSTQYRGRYMEVYSVDLAIRSVERTSDGVITVNGAPVALRAARVPADVTIGKLNELVGCGINSFVVGAGAYNEKIYKWADQNGIYMIPTVAINSSLGGQTIKRGGNPTNDPKWRDYYVERADDLFRATQLHPSVIAFNLAEKSLNGDNLYHSYLHLKSFDDPRPVIYFDGGGEWNSDYVKMFEFKGEK